MNFHAEIIELDRKKNFRREQDRKSTHLLAFFLLRLLAIIFSLVSSSHLRQPLAKMPKVKYTNSSICRVLSSFLCPTNKTTGVLTRQDDFPEFDSL